MIARDPDQRISYNARLKFQRDEESRLTLARIEARKEGLEKGEQIGLEKGELIGMLKSYEALLGLALSDTNALTKLDHSVLLTRIDELQRQIRDRFS